MRKVILCILILVNIYLDSCAQIITTIGGGGLLVSESISATSVRLTAPAGGSFDKYGNFYFGQNFTNPKISKINSANIINTVVGNNIFGFSGDGGPATDASISFPFAVVDDIGNIFIADRDNHRIRKVDVTSGNINTIAGTGLGGVSGISGSATNINIYPNAICLDGNGNIFFLDSSTRIRKVNSSGNLSTIAGNGIFGYTGDGGNATNAAINPTYGLCADRKGNIYIGCYGYIRKVNLISGIISTIAGNGNYSFNGDSLPARLAQINPFMLTIDDFGNLFIADYLNQRIRIVTSNGFIYTLVGNGTSGFSGDMGNPQLAELYNPEGIAIDKCGNLYIADEGNNRIRKVTYPKCNYLSVDDNQLNNTLAIYPNPITLTLQIDNLKTITQYLIYNIVGTAIMQGTLKPGDNTLRMDALEPGIYILVLIDEEGEKTVHKIVKQ